MNFLIYHSGFVSTKPEGPYDARRTDGIDALITSVQASGVRPNSNVYAELGSTWRFLSMRDPDSAAHAMGKLFKHIGEDNVLWGTDSIWYGSPQDQIQAFRTFQISEALRDKHGYPQITPQLRAKVFGLNATRPYQLAAEELGKFTARDQRRAGARRICRATESFVCHVWPAYATRIPEPACVARGRTLIARAAGRMADPVGLPYAARHETTHWPSAHRRIADRAHFHGSGEGAHRTCARSLAAAIRRGLGGA